MKGRIDWAYRRASYFGSLDTKTRILNRVSGTVRRSSVEQAMEDGSPLAVPADELDPLLDEQRLRRWGRVHPSMMGGEYLPEIVPGEIEIARIELQSVTADVISIRALEGAGGIDYSVVDEHESEYNVAIPHSPHPLSMRQVVQQINRSYAEGDHWCERLGVPLGVIAMNLEYEADPDTMLSFVTVRSDFYPQLENYFDRLCTRYVLRRMIDRDAS